MAHANRTPKDLAHAVCAALSRKSGTCPKLAILIDLFETMYYASLQTEESQRVSFHMVYLDPTDPDPDPPSNMTQDRWRVVQLATSVPLTTANLIKLATASDPRTSSFAIYHNVQEGLFVWGFVDQGSSYSDFVNYEAEEGAARPGLFQATIAGTGHLIAFIEMEKVAELKVNVLITDVSDILGGGPVREALQPGIESYLKAVYSWVPKARHQSRSHWEASLIATWLQSLSRLLLRMQRYRHGGAILITPDNSLHWLNIKYELPYDRLRSALESNASLRIDQSYFSDKIWEDYVDQDAETVPVDLYLEESIARDHLKDNRRELEGTIWFLSLLTRVDGLLLLNPSLELQGFGVEITIPDEPASVYIAGNRSATEKKLRLIDYNHYGTRHRSMMRYCSHVPGSVGFVVSQDGDVRAMTKVRGQLVMWENIKLQLPDFVQRRRRT
jgi:Probable sensor domain DACNV